MLDDLNEGSWESFRVGGAERRASDVILSALIQNDAIGYLDYEAHVSQ